MKNPLIETQPGLTRRSFIKKSSIAAASFGVLASGIAIARSDSSGGCGASCSGVQSVDNSAGYQYFYYNQGLTKRKYTKVKCYCSNGHFLGYFKEQDSLVTGVEDGFLIMEHDQGGENLPYHPNDHYH